MINKKLLLGFFIFGLLFSNPVSSQYYSDLGFGTERFINSLTENLEPILIALFGGQDYTGYLLFEKLLLFFLVTIFSYLALSNFPFFEDKNKYLAKLVAIIVALLGIRNLDYLWLNTIFTQYSVLFIAIAGILPFVIYWFFLRDFDSIVRKVGWVFFSVIYFGLWVTTGVDAHQEIYLITALSSLAYAFIFDTMVCRWFQVQQFKKGKSNKVGDMIASYSEQIDEINERIRMGHYRDKSLEKKAEKRAKELERKILKLQKSL